MIGPGLKKWAKQNNWKIGRKMVYGEYNGYCFTAFDGTNLKCFTVYLPFLNDTQREIVLENLNQNKKLLRISDIKLENGLLTVTLNETWRPLKQEDMKKYLDHVTGVLKEHEVIGFEKCSLCGKEGSFEMFLLNDTLVTMCPECLESTNEESRLAEQEFEKSEKKYGRGLIGAFAGGIIASIPWIIISYFGWFAAILGFVIGKGALKGYQIFGGMPGRATRWIIAASTVFSIVSAEIAALTVAVMVVNEIPFSLDIIYFIFTSPDILRSVAPNLLVGLFMGYMGIVKLFIDIKKDVDSSIPKVEKA